MRFLLITLIWLVPVVGAAQPQGPKGDRHFDPQKFQQMVEQSLTKAANLTQEEAKVFFPLYNEMRSKQREMGKQIHQLKKDCKGDAQGCASTILRIKKLQVEMAVVGQNYYQRMLKVIPPEKVFKVMEAEDDFHRRMVQGQRSKPRDGKPGTKPRE